MTPERIEQLKREYTGRRVLVDESRPELARLAGTPGRVVTVNFNGNALVQFEGRDASWHEIDPAYLKLEPSP
ncbi:MAG: hypothetical protein GX594_10015 [Pirellulaceae bacterium]|nr:hypothetical protein [Pirellulaceae bacterium]